MGCPLILNNLLEQVHSFIINVYNHKAGGES